MTYWNEYWQQTYRWTSPKRASILQNIGKALRVGYWFLPFVVTSVFVQMHIVHGQSMEPNISPEQRILAEKVSYQLHGPERGDVVILESGRGDKQLIKRVIGLAGEVVEIRDSKVYINGRLLTEPYFFHNALQANFGPLVIPENHIFVLGDNRGNSNDSRYFGPISLARVTSRAWLSYWPLTKLGMIS